jgi:hypothetical protein
MLKYILIAFIFCISTPSFCASKSFANSSLSMSYERINYKNKNVFSINKNALFALKLIKKKRFPIFGIGSIISFVLAFLSIEVVVSSDRNWVTAIPFVLLLLSLISGIVSLVIGEFWIWAVLGLLLDVFSLIFLFLIGRNGKQC